MIASKRLFLIDGEDNREAAVRYYPFIARLLKPRSKSVDFGLVLGARICHPPVLLLFSVAVLRRISRVQLPHSMLYSELDRMSYCRSCNAELN